MFVSPTFSSSLAACREPRPVCVSSCPADGSCSRAKEEPPGFDSGLFDFELAKFAASRHRYFPPPNAAASCVSSRLGPSEVFATAP